MTNVLTPSINLLTISEETFLKEFQKLSSNDIFNIKNDSYLTTEITKKLNIIYKQTLEQAQHNLNHDFSSFHNSFILSLLTPEQKGIIYLYSLVNNDFLVHPFLVNEDFNLNEAIKLRNHNPDSFILYKETERFEEFSRFQYVAQKERNNAFLHLHFDYPNWIVKKLMPIYDNEKCFAILVNTQRKNIDLAKRLSELLLLKNIDLSDLANSEYVIPKKYITNKHYNLCIKQILTVNNILNVKNFSNNQKIHFHNLMTDKDYSTLGHIENFVSTYKKHFLANYLQSTLEENLSQKKINSSTKMKI